MFAYPFVTADSINNADDSVDIILANINLNIIR